MVETGLTRAKNAGNIVMKNVMDFALGTVVFWVIGFGLMFGDDISGIIGAPDFFIQNWQVADDAGYPTMAYVIFQTVFCATSATIVSACSSAAGVNSVASPYEAMTASTLTSSSSEVPRRRSMVTTAALFRVGYAAILATTTSPSDTPSVSAE